MTGQPKRRILVVDDDPAINATLHDGLSLLGDYEVIAATDGIAGLERVAMAAPDCIIVDVRMPGLNGYQLVRALRGDPATAGIPIILLSALNREHHQLAGLLTGADAYLLKPVRLNDLLRAVADAMHLSAAERRARDGFLAGDPTLEQGGGE